MPPRFSNVRASKILLAIYWWLKSLSYCATCTAALEKEAINYIKKLEILPIKILHQIRGPPFIHKERKW